MCAYSSKSPSERNTTNIDKNRRDGQKISFEELKCLVKAKHSGQGFPLLAVGRVVPYALRRRPQEVVLCVELRRKPLRWKYAIWGGLSGFFALSPQTNWNIAINIENKQKMIAKTAKKGWNLIILDRKNKHKNIFGGARNFTWRNISRMLAEVCCQN